MAMAQKRPHRGVSEIARPATPGESRPVRKFELSRYDVLLGAIPVALLVAWLVGQLAGIPFWASLSVGALVTLPALVDGLALHPPS